MKAIQELLFVAVSLGCGACAAPDQLSQSSAELDPYQSISMENSTPIRGEQNSLNPHRRGPVYPKRSF